MPLNPSKPGAVANSVPNTDSVFASPAFTISQTASVANTRISNRPRSVPATAPTLTPNQPSRNTMSAAPTAAIGHQVSKDQPYSVASVLATTFPKMR